MLLRGGRIQTGFGLFVPCGLRAGALVGNCFAVGRTTDTSPAGFALARSLLTASQLVEPPTRGFSVDVLMHRHEDFQSSAPPK